jgi:hypothetical protein
MSHLSETGYGYFDHLLRSWKVAGVLLIHGLLPNIWKTKASDLLCVNSNATRKYLLEKQYGIIESSGRCLSED